MYCANPSFSYTDFDAAASAFPISCVIAWTYNLLHHHPYLVHRFKYISLQEMNTSGSTIFTLSNCSSVLLDAINYLFMLLKYFLFSRDMNFCICSHFFYGVAFRSDLERFCFLPNSQSFPSLSLSFPDLLDREHLLYDKLYLYDDKAMLPNLERVIRLEFNGSKYRILYSVYYFKLIFWDQSMGIK